MVTGGFGPGGIGQYNTELYKDEKWITMTTSNTLQNRVGAVSITLNNVVYLTGEFSKILLHSLRPILQ